MPGGAAPTRGLGTAAACQTSTFCAPRVGERARIRPRDRAHEVRDLRGRPLPIDLAVGRPAAAEISGRGFALRHAWRVARQDLRQQLVEQRARGRRELAVQRGRVVGRRDRHAMLAYDVPGVGLRVM